MSIIHGSANHIELAGTSLQQDDKGMITISASFGFQDYSSAADFLQLRGDSLDGATRTSASMETDGSGLWAVQCSYSKASDPDKDQDEDKEKAESSVKSLDITIKEIGIDLHPKFEALKLKYGWDAEKKAFPYMMPKVPGKKDEPSPLAGVEQYMVTGVTYTEASSYKEIPATIYEGINKILQGNPPGLSSLNYTPKGKENWIYMAPKIKQKGAGYEVEQTWQLSGENGWNTDIYETEPQHLGVAVADPLTDMRNRQAKPTPIANQSVNDIWGGGIKKSSRANPPETSAEALARILEHYGTPKS